MSLYKLLHVHKKLAIRMYNRLKKSKGLACMVKVPVNKDSIFGLEDVVDYDELVATPMTLLLFGLMKEGEQGIEEYDTFHNDCYALTLYEEKLPQQTLIEVNFCGVTMSYKVDTHLDPLPSVCGHLFIKNMLVPAT